MQDLPSPRNGNGSSEAYAKPIMMFQPEETRVKQRQRLLSDEITKQPQPVNRPPTPPGKLQIGKISSMLLRDFAGGKPVADAELSPSQTSPEPHANGLSGHHSSGAQRALLKPESDCSSEETNTCPQPVTPPHGKRNARLVAEAIAQFEERIVQKSQPNSASKQKLQTSPEEGSRPPSHQSSQRADALRQLQELWLSDEAEQQPLPDSSQGQKAPSPQQAPASRCNGVSALSLPALQCYINGHSATSSPEQQEHGRNDDLKEHLPAQQENGHPAAGSAQERSRQHASDAPRAIPSSHGHDSASSQQDRQSSGDSLRSTERSDVQHRRKPLLAEPVAQPLHPSMTDLVQGPHRKQSKEEGSAARQMPEVSQASGSEQGSQQVGSPVGNVRPGCSLQPPQVAEGALPGSSSNSSSVCRPSEDAVPLVHATAQQGPGDAEHAAPRDLPVSVGAARVSDDVAAPTSPGHMPAAAQPPAVSQSSAGSSAGQAEPGVPQQAPEPAWVSGFRGDMGLAMSTPFLQHSARFALRQHEHSSPPLPHAKLGSESSLESGGSRVDGKYQDSSEMATPFFTPQSSLGRARQGASHAATAGSQSRGALMQGWRSIMHGSPEQSSGKRSASACSQKSGLDLAWRLNEVVHELSSCLARTAEQQQLLADAARLLIRGEEEDPGYAADKLQAADELRQWSEAAQCSSIACLVGILKELQQSRQARMEEVHLTRSAWLPIMGSRGHSLGNGTKKS